MKSLASYVFLLFISSTATADDIDLKCQANTKEKETDLILTGEKIEFRIKNTQHTWVIPPEISARQK